MTTNNALLIMWIAFTAAATLGVSGILLWAVRSRQFSNQDRARYLPLTSGIPGRIPNSKPEIPNPQPPGTSTGGNHVQT